MSCEQGATRLSLASRLSAGIGQLAGKRGFYAGLALGGIGLLGAGVVALARRRSDPRKGEASSAANRQALIDPQQIPNLESRRQVAPLTSPSPTTPCETCQTPAKAKPGLWYRLDGRTYCQDCAPAAARKAGVDLVRASSRADTSPGASPRAADTAGQGSTSMTDYLSPQRRINTRLMPSRIALNIGSETEPARCIVEQGYVLVRPDGYDTGLALTPGLKTQQDAQGTLVIREDTGQWWLTHIASGRRVTDQPYVQREQAHVLGNILAQMDWTRDEAEFSPADYRRAGATIAYFNQSLAEAGGGVGSGEAADSLLTPTRRVPAEPLTGKLVADGYGGVSRVLEDNGDTLFLIDSLGKRYEITRNEARVPDESDFELCRVAMSFDPAQQPDAHCATCQRSARDTGAGEMWYKMGWQAFCETCSTDYAANEGYLKEEEIDTDLESLG